MRPSRQPSDAGSQIPQSPAIIFSKKHSQFPRSFSNSGLPKENQSVFSDYDFPQPKLVNNKSSFKKKRAQISVKKLRIPTDHDYDYHDEPIARSNIESIPHYMIVCPADSGSRTDRTNTSFASFNAIMQSKLSQSYNQTEETLFTPFKNRDALTQQLDFNKKQKEMIKTIAKNDIHDSINNLKLLADKQERKKHKVTVHHFSTFRGFKLAFADKPKSKKDLDNNSTKEDDDDDEEEEDSVKTAFELIKVNNNSTWSWYWYPRTESLHWKPGCREGATLVHLGRFAYLYGGVSRGLHNQIEVLDTLTMEWSAPKQTGDLPEKGRQGHSMDIFEKILVLFGGGMSFNSSLHMRECLSEVRYFLTETKEWKYIKCTGTYITARRNHASAIVGKNLLVYGGIDGNGQYLNDIKILDLLRYEWRDCNVDNHNTIGMAFHRACVVLSSNKIKFSLHKIIEGRTAVTKAVAKIQEEGIYFYGGKTQDGQLNSTLRVLKLGHSTLKWVTPKTQGVPPEPRYLHTMVHCPALNLLVVYGGRNDTLYTKGKSPVISEIFALELESLTWINVPMSGLRPQPRYSHVATVVGTKMLVFGGMTLSEYCSADVQTLELDPVVAQKKRMRTELDSRGSANRLPKMGTRITEPEEKTLQKVGSVKDLKKKEYTIQTFLPVVSKEDFERKKMSRLNINLHEGQPSMKNIKSPRNVENYKPSLTVLANRVRKSTLIAGPEGLDLINRLSVKIKLPTEGDDS